MKPVWKMCLGMAMLSVVVLLFTTLPVNIAPTSRGRSPADAAIGNQSPTGRDRWRPGVWPFRARYRSPLIGEAPVVTDEEILLDREVNPRLGLEGSVDP